MTTPPRIFVVGTDTEVGKTTVSVALLHAARRAGRTMMAFKPAVSGDLGDTSDHARLARAMGRDGLDADTISVHRYAPPIAPGLAEAGHPFFDHERTHNGAVTLAARRATQRLVELESKHQPELTLIEGAGGLHVPMPGGTWLADWIAHFGARPLVVARAGLGTINHTTLTVEALRALELPPIAFVLNEIESVAPDALHDNRRVLEARLGLDCLGVLPHRAHEPDADTATDWIVDDWFERFASS